MLTAADRLALLDAHFDIQIRLTPDRLYLDVRGPSDAIEAASPMLTEQRNELVAHLRRASADDHDAERGQ